MWLECILDININYRPKIGTTYQQILVWWLVYLCDCFAESGHNKHSFGMEMAAKYIDLTIISVNDLSNKDSQPENQYLISRFYVAINKTHILIYVFVTFC